MLQKATPPPLFFFLYSIEQDPRQLTEADVEAMSVGNIFSRRKILALT